MYLVRLVDRMGGDRDPMVLLGKPEEHFCHLQKGAYRFCHLVKMNATLMSFVVK